MVRRHDPERRRRIIDAAIRVVGRRGIAGLSHRTVAAEAQVPLGSTTYHFASLDELLVAALRQANEGFAAAVRDSAVLADPRSDPAGELARLLGEWLGGERSGVELEYELYLAALRRPALRPVVAEWTEGVTEALARRSDPVTARALVAFMDGICLQVLLTDTAYDEEYTRAMLARILAGGTTADPDADAATGT
ncbi:TetR family transcriptional regulator [Streptomyces sp. ICN441]|uniref:TetR family transcriptional regulator n=1 Tax=Streptomyces tirandamycinicus TaxID=2174846 RepID=A0A2S1SNA5_9ACTN|nr:MULTISPECIES: TetR family transcriptional regulator [Streptomyces]AWI27826.1 TetR family transcriptional regulator [Streptomyces tirandamycinicus]MCY0984143.1 TetR family transcriptional regulator [Streptomyces tirandamycinicus]NNJ06300.1 TetR family transcriptional regulator [Streptomyces sp. PKU-MA01144]TFE43201.1 TetR family transcriptional regulator [Streptomyces sp. ICN441]